MTTASDAIEKIRDFINQQIEPGAMSRTDAVGVLEEVVAEINGMLDALRDELDADADDANAPSENEGS